MSVWASLLYLLADQSEANINHHHKVYSLSLATPTNEQPRSQGFAQKRDHHREKH